MYMYIYTPYGSPQTPLVKQSLTNYGCRHSNIHTKTWNHTLITTHTENMSNRFFALPNASCERHAKRLRMWTYKHMIILSNLDYY